MRRRATIAAALTVLAGVAVLVVLAATDERRLAFTLSVRPSGVAAVVPPGVEACQRDVEVEAPFDEARLLYGTYFRPGPALAVRVLDHASGRVLARGALPPGYPDDRKATARLARAVPEGSRVDVCLRNVGQRRVAVFGGPASDNEPSYATVGGRPLRSDLGMELLRQHPRTVLSLVPSIVRRAALFHPGWVGPWTFWVLLALLLVAFPALLIAALRGVTRA
jgi:hypothetical protein